MVRLANTQILPVDPSVAVTWLLTVCPWAKLRFDANGMLLPHGNTVRKPGPSGSLTATFNDNAVVPSGAPSGIPATALPSTGATPSPRPSRTPKPSTTPAPTPTAPTGPTLSAFTLNPYPRDDLIDEDPPGSGHYPIYQVGCTIGDWTVGLYIEAKDPDGIASVTLYYKPQGVSDPLQATMGEEGPGEWYTEIYPEDGWSLGEIDYWITAVDGADDSTTFNGPSNKTIVYTVCND